MRLKLLLDGIITTQRTKDIRSNNIIQTNGLLWLYGRGEGEGKLWWMSERESEEEIHEDKAHCLVMQGQ